MTKILSAFLVVLSLSLFGAGAVSALDSSPSSVASQDGDKGKKKHGKKKHQDGKKHGKKKHHKKQS